MAEGDRERWDARYAAEDAADRAAPAWIEELDAELPREGEALDVAAGSGRLALFAARRGLRVTAVDVSPVGLSLARDRARGEGHAITTVALDLESAPLPGGSFALVTCFHYYPARNSVPRSVLSSTDAPLRSGLEVRQPSLVAELRGRLAPGGVLLAEMLTEKNLERHAHPSRRWLAATNELLGWAQGLEVVFYREGWLEGRHTSRLLARRSPED